MNKIAIVHIPGRFAWCSYLSERSVCERSEVDDCTVLAVLCYVYARSTAKSTNVQRLRYCWIYVSARGEQIIGRQMNQLSCSPLR
jgi:hypothetical protein